MAVNPKTRLAISLFVTVLISAILITTKAHWKVWTSEAVWKFSTAISLCIAWVHKTAGDGAAETMGYLNANAQGVTALVAIIGLLFNIYYQMKHPKKTEGEE